MLRGSVEGVMGASFNGRSSVDEDEKAADDVSQLQTRIEL
jgi:hypothetical protein